MADKDIREDDGAHGDMPLPPDGPRSEGGPARGDVADETTGRSAAARVDEAAANLDVEVPAAESHADVEIANETAPPEPDSSAAPRETEAWHGAIADVLAEPEDEPAASPSESHDDASASSNGDGTADAFTAAAEDLFRPPALEADHEPHLITLGRRLDPSLRIPRPVAPDIQPKAEPLRAVATPDAAQAPWWQTQPWGEHVRTGLRYGLYIVGGYLALVLVLIILFRFVNPPGSALMLRQLLTGTSIDRTWVPLSSISPALVRAVVVSEDGRFCEHSGIDTEAIKEAIERASGGVPRGASTISMQVVKNLFLWNSKSYVRKVIEIPLTLFMEMVWPKRRVLEVYLNIAEWGPGVFGAEAAARHHFNKSASRLSERESALLAAVLPNPLLRDAGSPGAQTSAKARVVQSRVRAYGAVASCVVSASAKAPVAAGPLGTRTKPVQQRKTAPPRPVKKPPPPEEDWAPTLNFGPR
ncbi:MAG: monofunctional biosynthetic peptidoglycan transglycosylase [Hyphomicrobium sp.]|uniref:monofunctional biosynthetic peptidoglycan transglycosylase n=1 Tax=Hyphomicrobium sp. TaxID=82 RepID=UPI003D143225